jgi:hypothetical protein
LSPDAFIPVTANPDFSGAPVELLFAGLAPSMYGVYQVDVRLPELVLSPTIVRGAIGCRIGDSTIPIAAYLPLRSR